MEELLYRDCIKKLNPSHLKTIAEAHGLVLIPFSSQTALNELIKRFEDEGFIHTILDALNDFQRGVLFFISLFFKSMTAPDITALIRNFFRKDAEVDEALKTVLDNGIVFHVYVPDNNASYFFIPSDSSALVEKFCYAQLNHLFTSHSADTDKVHRCDTPICIALFSLFHYALNNDLKVNIDNSLNKRSINKIRAYLGSESSTLNTEVAERFVNGLFNYALTTNMLVLNEEYYKVNSPAINECLSSIKHLYGSFCRTALFIRNAENTEFWPEYAVLLSKFEPDVSYPIEMLQRIVSAFFPQEEAYNNCYKHDPLQVYPIFILFRLGIIQFLISDSHTVHSWKITQSGIALLSGKYAGNEKNEFDNGLIVQPNYDLIISQNADPALLWQLFQIADLVQSEFLLRFHLSRDSVYRGLSKKMCADAIISLLAGHSKQAIPQNVIYSLTEWCEEYGSVYFMDVFLLRCKNKNIADHIKIHPKTREYIVGVFSETDLIVRKEEYQVVLTVLKEIGFMPLDTVRDPYQSGDVETKLNSNGMHMPEQFPHSILQLKTYKFRFLPGLIHQ
ncbi:helicase-associated domain-containing protein [bacterium]|nr:helicase-associated domain-containing protein [bacterium]